MGSRPSSVIWVKAKYLKQLRSVVNNAELMYDLLLGVDRLPKSFAHRCESAPPLCMFPPERVHFVAALRWHAPLSGRGKPLMITNKNGGYNTMGRERGKWYTLAGAKAKNHPSGGFARPLSLLASGLCTRVDIYGFSARPTGKYFQRKFKVLPTHMMPFEHWVYRYLQSIGKLCVYGD